MMTKNEPESIEIIRKKYEKVSERFDRYENALIGNLYNKLEWENLIEIYLPKDKNARILDAGGGTGTLKYSYNHSIEKHPKINKNYSNS